MKKGTNDRFWAKVLVRMVGGIFVLAIFLAFWIFFFVAFCSLKPGPMYGPDNPPGSERQYQGEP
jgi:hypothetical protein